MQPFPFFRIRRFWTVLAAMIFAFAAVRPVNAGEVYSFTDGSVLSEVAQGSAAAMATDGAGVWGAVWVEATSPSDWPIRFSRSTDNAVTWSAAVDLDAVSDSYPRNMQLVTDREGNWIAMWTDYASILYVASHDNGATWLPKQVLAVGVEPSVAMSSNGTTLATWRREGEFSDFYLEASRSMDGGASWSTSQTVTQTYAFTAAIATDDQGHWIVVTRDSSTLVETHSLDDGLTWSPATVPHSDPDNYYGLGMDNTPSLATDKLGRWMLLYRIRRTTNFDILIVQSTDNGATWSEPKDVDQNASLTMSYRAQPAYPRLVYSQGRWLATWSASGAPYHRDGTDIVYSYSDDNGQNWRRVAAINPDAATVGFRDAQGVATDGNGVWVALLNELYYDQEIGKRWILRSEQPCPAIPQTGCRGTSTRQSKLQISNLTGFKDSLRWTWKRGDATSVLDFGDPISGDRFATCLYVTEGPETDLVFGKVVPNGTGCTNADCWSAGETGFDFEDRHQTRSPVRQVILKAGDQGESALSMKMGSAALDPPDLPFPLASTVTAQLVNLDNLQCWEAKFSLPTQNTTETYKASSD